jgi:hypothetical protein
VTKGLSISFERLPERAAPERHTVIETSRRR